MELTAITPDIHRLVIPFLDIYTTVFLLETPDGAVLFDTATYPEDADNYILPALRQRGITPQSLRCVVISHNHRDHAGSLMRIRQEYPATPVLTGSVKLREQYPDAPVLCSGGVASNRLIRERLSQTANAVFAPPQYSTDNALGVAVLTHRALQGGELRA